MDRIIFKKIFFFVSRYMMLIENQDSVYMLDRNNCVFQVNNLYFPKDVDCKAHLINTLVDGVSFFLLL